MTWMYSRSFNCLCWNLVILFGYLMSINHYWKKRKNDINAKIMARNQTSIWLVSVTSCSSYITADLAERFAFNYFPVIQGRMWLASMWGTSASWGIEELDDKVDSDGDTVTAEWVADNIEKYRHVMEPQEIDWTMKNWVQQYYNRR